LSNILNQIGFFLNALSVLILLIGIFICFGKSYNSKWLYVYICFLFILEVISRILGYYLKNNYFIISLSFFLNFLFLTFFYLEKIYKANRILTLNINILALLLFILTYHLQPYDRFTYSLVITCYSLIFIHKWLQGSIKSNRASFLLNASILLFFCVDAFLAIATDYLVNNSLELVSWFWFFRGILLQVFYITLIYYAWKTGKSLS